MSARETRLTGIGVGQLLAEIGVAPPVRRPYSAPERLGGSAWDRRADIFSLAALVHELLWGRRISGTGVKAVEGMTALAGGDLDALKRVFKRALADDPMERHPTAKIFVDALRARAPRRCGRSAWVQPAGSRANTACAEPAPGDADPAREREPRERGHGAAAAARAAAVRRSRERVAGSADYSGWPVHHRTHARSDRCQTRGRDAVSARPLRTWAGWLASPLTPRWRRRSSCQHSSSRIATLSLTFLSNPSSFPIPRQRPSARRRRSPRPSPHKRPRSRAPNEPEP